jgi:hypothetical protein
MPQMNYEDMIQRTIDGLTLVKTKVPTADVAVHSHIICIPESVNESFSQSQKDDFFALGWSYNKELGWLIPLLG